MTHVERKMSLWLLACAAMVLIMIALGGYTRLSGSGLSIVDWKPLSGAIPPLSKTSWLELFHRYQLFPEFQKVNSTMTLPEFKFIYLVEYIHRLWGRAMGLVLLVPTLYAIFSHRAMLPRILVIWMLAGAQGFMGWYMVKSGLIDDPQVSPFRLTAHLLLAITILCLILKTVFNLRPTRAEDPDLSMGNRFLTLTVILVFTICYGGLTAGTHSGFIYNTFPDMNGHFLPEDMFAIHPFWKDVLYNPGTIQFMHRMLAFASLAVGLYVFLSSRNESVSPKLKHVAFMIAVALSVQIILGVATLVLQVPIWLGVLHQVWATITFSATFWGLLLCGKYRMLNPVALTNTQHL
jgi:cytochrome c oxidase assembly protein subunit 15